MTNPTHRIRLGIVQSDPEKLARYQQANTLVRAHRVGTGDAARDLLEDFALTYAEHGVWPSRDGAALDPAVWLDALATAELADETRRQRIRRQASRSLDAEQAQPATEPLGLDELLDEPDEDAAYRIHGVLPTGARAVLAAAYKTGKSTLVENLVRALVDDEPFLGTYEVYPCERVLIIDNELDARTLKRWLRDQGIRNTDRVDVLSLRGRVGSFDILNDDRRAEWARALEGADVVIFDCLRPVLDALGLDESREAGRFLVAFDALLAEMGAQEAVLVHHMGHQGERSRGDSRIQDWPDVTWKLVREDQDDPTSLRYFSAYGRDVDVPEQQLAYDTLSRRLTIAGGSRKSGALEERVDAVVEFLDKSPGTSKEGIKRALLGNDKITAKAVEAAVERGLIRARTRQGKGGGMAYFLAENLTPVNPGQPLLTVVTETPEPPVNNRGSGSVLENGEPA